MTAGSVLGPALTQWSIVEFAVEHDMLMRGVGGVRVEITHRMGCVSASVFGDVVEQLTETAVREGMELSGWDPNAQTVTLRRDGVAEAGKADAVMDAWQCEARVVREWRLPEGATHRGIATVTIAGIGVRANDRHSESLPG